MNSPVTRTRTDAVANRQRILDSARKVFARKGLAAEMREIADEAGVAVGTLYRHFASREDLVSTFLAECRAELVSKLLPLVDSDDPVGAFREILRIGANCREDFGKISEDLLRGQLHKHVAIRSLSDLLKKGVEQGAFRKDLNIPVVIAVAESIFFCGLSFLDNAGQGSFVDGADAISDFLLIGMVSQQQEKKV